MISDEKLYREIREIMLHNKVTGYSQREKTQYTYIKPSKDFYNHQYFWDTCFHIHILCALGEIGLAKDCFRTQFAMQTDSGFVGHIHYWKHIKPSRITDIFQNRASLGWDLFRPHMSALIQPPLVAQALQRIRHASGDVDFMKEMLPKLKKYFDWLHQNRNFDGDHLIGIITPFESGMDWKASYDPVIGFRHGRPNKTLFWKVIGIDVLNFLDNYRCSKIKERNRFLVKDAGFNAFYAQNLRALAKMCKEVGDADHLIYSQRFEAVRDSMLNLLYDEEAAAFFDVYGPQNTKLKILTPTIFFPIVLDGMPSEIRDRILEKHFHNPKEFNTAYPIPSLAVEDPAFDPGQSTYIWRGPTWIVNNWFMHQFFMEKGYHEEAQHLIKAIKELIDKSGFREYYDPNTGKGHGAKQFTWAGLVVDMMEMEQGKRTSQT